MHGDDGLSPTHEMYLKVLHGLQRGNEVGRVRDLAKGLGVTPSTVSAVLKKLETAGLVLHDRYGSVKLTPAGYRVAECIVHRFEILRAFLTQVLGLGAEQAEVDACLMEHAVSPATVNRMESLLEFVRTSGVSLARAQELPVLMTGCSECVATGTCRAVAAIEPKLPRGSEN